MKLDIHLQQSKLLYLIRDSEDIAIKENQHYRFLCFADVVQSIMLKRRPASLTLPHQYFLTLPLLFIRPKNIIEFGLGGGNLLKFARQLLPSCKLTSVEENFQVIQCFKQYFNPQQTELTINCQDASSWLSQQSSVNSDWLIFDIYRNDRDDNSALALISELLQRLANTCWLSINLVDLAEPQLNKLLNYLNKTKGSRKMNYFIVPQYRNIIVQLYPEPGLINQQISPLKPYQINRYRKLWQQANVLNR